MSFSSIACKQRGLSLATALFVITVMALLAGMIFQLIRNNAETTQEEILLNRAFSAAETGVQFGLNALFPPGTDMNTCDADYDFEQGGLAQCSASVVCSSVAVNDVTYYTIESTGTCGDVSRTVQVRAQ